MRSLTSRLPASRQRHIGLLAAALLLFAALAHPLRAESAVSRDDIVKQLTGLDAAPDLDIAALREQVLKRSQSKSRNEPPPQKRPPIAPDLTKLPTFNVNIQFDPDTPIVLPIPTRHWGASPMRWCSRACCHMVF